MLVSGLNAMEINLFHPEYLEITCPDGKAAMGGSQKWYPERWEKAAGCGPTAASNLIWYIARAHPDLRCLCDDGSGDYTRFLELMREVFSYIKPGIGGVNTSTLFVDGVKRYASARNADPVPHVLEIPFKRKKRPKIGAVSDFIIGAMKLDSPVAFLCLSSGKLKTPENWHWVTITGYDTNSANASIIDYGSEHKVKIVEWLGSSLLGGCFVYFTA